MIVLYHKEIHKYTYSDTKVKKNFTSEMGCDTIIAMDLIAHTRRKEHLAKPNEHWANMPDDEILAEIDRSLNAGEDYWYPFHLYINANNVKQLKPYLPELLTLTKKRRQEAVEVLEFYIADSQHVKLSIPKMCEAVGINYASFHGICKEKPAIWKFINILLIEDTREKYDGRVESAVADSALHGNHQDRRLYLELTGKVQRGGGARQPGGVNIVFVQDAMSRPGVEGRTVTIGSPRAIGELDTSPLESSE